jgi:hypothetical protein
MAVRPDKPCSRQIVVSTKQVRQRTPTLREAKAMEKQATTKSFPSVAIRRNRTGSESRVFPLNIGNI